MAALLTDVRAKQLKEVRAAIEEHRLMPLLMKTEHCNVCEAIQAKVESMVEKMPGT
ncbi:hypothetical protein M6D81_10450 [Paenibacillus sp. J5C_2022]|uniref:hypothetical protein n=1 Tax=Paenibacillus sp. J5C2022 TaxID=2977129 RepID=UPI0021CECFDE|nr:hypothetical protein [Paenibacillus sp. J5C2022]MCU6709131.1 hypothetical protein [Paenibacillus sp. J5C2022]